MTIPDGFTLVPNSALRWLFGEEGDFIPSVITPEYKNGKRPYWWRSEFRKRIEALAEGQQSSELVEKTSRDTEGESSRQPSRTKVDS